jgi:hypothetical protein
MSRKATVNINIPLPQTSKTFSVLFWGPVPSRCNTVQEHATIYLSVTTGDKPSDIFTAVESLI